MLLHPSQKLTCSEIHRWDMATFPPAELWQLADTNISSNPSDFTIERPWFSTQPVFCQKQDNAFSLATSWETLAAQGANTPDLGYVKDYLRFQTPSTHRTLARGIRLLKHGERVRINRDTLTVEPLPFPVASLPPSHIRQRLCEQLKDTQDACFHLSSGLDSSLLVLLARRLGKTVHAVTLRTRGKGAAQELEMVKRLADETKITLSIFDFTDIDIWQEGERMMTAGLGYPVAHPSHLVRYLLDRTVVESGLGRRIVTGRGPDEVLGGYDVHRPAYADASRHFSRLTCMPEDRVTALFNDGESGNTALAHADFFCDSITLQQRLNYDLGAIYEAWNILEADFSKSLDIEYISPFLAPDIMAAFYALPDSEKVSEHAQKIFLRTAFADVYPSYILSNPKIGLTIDLRHYMLDQSAESIVKIMYDQSEFGKRFLNRAACMKLVDDTLTGRANYGWQIWNLYLCGLACRKLNS